MPVVSIIMPAYNAAKVVAAAIDSILVQTFRDFELLICDDASTDTTFDIVQSYTDPRIRYYRNKSNHGYLKTCNFLFNQVRGDYIAFQDADDLTSPTRIEKQVHFLKTNLSYGLCGTRAWYFRTGVVKPVRWKNVPVEHEEIYSGLYQANQFCGASVLVRTKVLKDVGYYQNFFDRIGNEDYDAFFRVAQRYRVANLSEHLYFVRLTTGSISRVYRSPKQYISSDIVKFLAKEREKNGKDALTGFDSANFNRFLEEKLLPFKRDKSLLHRKNADLQAYNKNRFGVLRFSLNALVESPLKLINIKYFLHSFFLLFKRKQ